MTIIQQPASRRTLAAAVALCCTALAGTTVQAQEGEVEEIVVTGSLLPRQTDMPQPVVTIDSEQLLLEQKSTVAEIFKTLPQNTGSVSTITTQEGAGNSSTTTINLRGLGFRSNLVLVNGRRTTISGSGTGVDVNNMAPSIMIDRIEMLTDGASAIYGSDAVSGVVNFITRNNFEGTETRLNFQKVEDARRKDTPDINFGIISGAQGVNTSIVGALEINRTESILAEEIFSPERMLITLQSSFANPGSFVPGAFGSPVAGRMPDPLCEDPRFSGGDGLSANLIEGNRCVQINAKGRTIQPDLAEVRAMTVITQDLDFGITGQYEVSFARKEVEIPFGFVTPLLFPLPVIPANNPGVIAANEADPNFVIQPYRWWGRPLSLLDGDTGAIHTTDNDTIRVALSFDGPIMDTGWDWRLSGTWSRSEEKFISKDALNNRLLNALQGYGGPGCQFTPETDPTGENQGVGDCQWFNPFGNHVLASPGDPEFNDPELLDFMIGSRVTEGVGELITLNALVSGGLVELPGGTASVAIGYQHRQQQFVRDFDDFSNQGRIEGGEGFRFNPDRFPDFSGDRDTDAVFGELVVPVLDNLELQAAVRWEETDNDSSVDPKFGVIFSPVEGFYLRGTYGTSFQLAREIETFGRSPGGSSTRSVGGEGINARGVSIGNRDLQAQESDNFTVGATWNVTDNFSVSVDWWDIEFENLVVAEDADIILSRELEDGFVDDFLDNIILRPGVPTEVCEVTGRWDPNSGMPAPGDCFRGTDIQTFVTSFVNQEFQNTAGLDFTVEYNWIALGSDWRFRTTGTFINEYDISTTGRIFDGVGKRNTLNFGVPNARWRGNAMLDWRRGDTFARGTLRWISEIEEDDVEGSPLSEEDTWVSLDLVAGTRLFGLDLTASVTNLWNQDDPATQNTLLPNTSSIYDWRGRVFRLGFEWSTQ